MNDLSDGMVYVAISADCYDAYPFVSNRDGADWLRAVDLPRSVKEKIAHKNAEKLLGIGPL